MKRQIILIKKQIPNIVFILLIAYICLNPDKIGICFGTFLKNVDLIMNKK
jgi:hypothetical protein